MTSTSTIDTSADGAGFESFWVPSCTVYAGPNLTSLTPVADVQRVSFRDNLNQIDAFDFTVGNRGWTLDDLRLATCLRGGTDEQPSLLPGAFARLTMGYRGVLGERLMLTGRVVGISPSFGADGAATLTVRALSELEALRKKPKSFHWKPAKGQSAITDSEIARRIGDSHQIQVLLPSGVKEPGFASITQSNETDISFLLRRARERGYVLAYRELPGAGGAAGAAVGAAVGGVFGAALGAAVGAEPRRVLYFGPSNLLGDAERTALGERLRPYRFAYGSALTDFRPTLNISTTLWRTVTLSFWDRRAKKKLPITDRLDGEKGLWEEERGLNQDLKALVELAATAEQKLPEIPVHTAEEARAVCRNQLRENFLGLVTADGACVGLPELRAASTVEVAGVGEPFSGTWRLTSTTHTIDESGYRTTFSARREQRIH
jgi:phage protein D